MKVCTGYTSSELMVKGSRFLAEVIPVENQAAARDALKAQKLKYADATHVCHAFICGLGAEVMGMSDDGEPSGTAGRPMLDVVKGRGVTNLLVTVTRWFGGTLLGTGGLVKAYGDSTKLVLEAAESAGLFEEYVERSEFSFHVAYELFDRVKQLMGNFTVTDVAEEYGTDITISGRIVAAELTGFADALKNLSCGKILL